MRIEIGCQANRCCRE